MARTILLPAFPIVYSILLVFQPHVADARPPLGQNWSAVSQVSMNAISHKNFDKLLKKYVDKDGFVNYGAWQKSTTDRKALQDYLKQLSRASRTKSATKNARLVFWINAYNAVTIEGILQVHPTTSIRNHTAKLFGYNIWKDLPLIVGRAQYSLHQIEHDILRKMGEPRIHFAIVCASIGCPRLRNEAYTTDKLQKQLADNTRDFFSRVQNFRADHRNRTIHVSAILDWFGDDFGATQAVRWTYLSPYLPKSVQTLATDSRTVVRFLDYNWNLNDQAKRAR